MNKNRKKYLKNVSRIVVKVGTNVLTKKNGDVNSKWVNNFANQICSLMLNNKEIIVVTSGSIGAGCYLLGMNEKPADLIGKQAAAAVGQTRLMRVYKDAFRRAGIRIGQILLTYDDLDSRLRSKNATNTINALLKMKVVPIINENDTVAVEEIKFGENDYLSALVSEFINADLLILLTDVDGVFDNPPDSQLDSQVVSSVCRKNWAKLELGISNSISDKGSGGMITKVQAARSAVNHGGIAVIANGKIEDILLKVIDGENTGTLFVEK